MLSGINLRSSTVQHLQCLTEEEHLQKTDCDCQVMRTGRHINLINLEADIVTN